MYDLTISIVNHETRDLLDQCLSSILNNHHNLKVEIIVLDNSSRDGSAEMVRFKYPVVTLIEQAERCGYSENNNKIVKLAHGSKILVLNPDVYLSPNFIREAVCAMDKDASAGSAVGKILSMNSKM